jgi:hypothetical protein
MWFSSQVCVIHEASIRRNKVTFSSERHPLLSPTANFAVSLHIRSFEYLVVAERVLRGSEVGMDVIKVSGR